jgi:hypothetical protein
MATTPVEPTIKIGESNISAILSKASELGIKIPAFPKDEVCPDDLPGVPTHGCALAPLEDLLSWNGELRTSCHDFASAHVSHIALLAQLEVSKQRIADADVRRRVAWAAWFYLQGCFVSVNDPPTPPRAKSNSNSNSNSKSNIKSKSRVRGTGKGNARARSSDESDVELVGKSVDRGDGDDGESDVCEGAEDRGVAGESSMDVC